jgi:hypothetical protein
LRELASDALLLESSDDLRRNSCALLLIGIVDLGKDETGQR